MVQILSLETVDYEILLAKLNHCVCGVLNDLFKSYLSDSQLYKSVNGYDSGLLKINCGVPQGSVLGPPYLAKSIKKFNKFLNIGLKNLANWLNTTKISLNVKKTKMVIFKSKRKKFNDN